MIELKEYVFLNLKKVLNLYLVSKEIVGVFFILTKSIFRFLK